MNIPELTFGEISEYCLNVYGKPLTYFIDLAILANCFHVEQDVIGTDEVGLQTYLDRYNFVKQFSTENGFGVSGDDEAQVVSSYKELIDRVMVMPHCNPRSVIGRIVLSVKTAFSPYSKIDSIFKSQRQCRFLLGMSILRYFNDNRDFIAPTLNDLVHYKNFEYDDGSFDFKQLFGDKRFKRGFNFASKPALFISYIKVDPIDKWIVNIVDSRTTEDRLFGFVVKDIKPFIEQFEQVEAN